ncbi:hypothetical protein OAP56_02735 [Rickettsiaceae bacterium]|nr:hypothetical protein [Rickettsiaceae bacterium]
MNNSSVSKLESLVNFCNNKLYKRKVIILVGKLGIYISALKKDQILRSIFIKYTNRNSKKLYQHFLNKYKKWNITFLIDHNSCKLKHEMLPIVTSIIESSPVESFIDENYSSDDIVAHNVYEITNQNGEMWNSCIASIPLTPPISDLLQYVLTNSFKYSGSYFLSLEFNNITEKLLQKSYGTQFSDYLQIFVTITESSGIKLIAKYKQNIMNDKTILYPSDKSDMYVQGTIEQAITDQLLFYKGYIEKLKLKVCIISLADNALQKLISGLKFDDCTIVLLESDNVGKKRSNRFQDNSLIKSFNNSNAHLALNKSLRSLTQFTFINNIIFKPMIILSLGITLTLANIKYKTFQVHTKTTNLNHKYYALSKEYRNMQKKYPNIENINDLIDLYNLENMINKPAVTPLNDLKNLLTSTRHPKVELSDIKWKIVDSQNLSSPEKKVNILVDYFYRFKDLESLSYIEITNRYANYLKYIFPKYEINYIKVPRKGMQNINKTTMPIHIVINGTIRDGNNNDR